MITRPDLRDGQPSDRPLRLLFVHAHPDDESLVTGVAIAHHAAAGDEVHVLTCTLGEEGEVIPDALAHLQGAVGDPLGPHRQGELGQALAELGATGHLLAEGAFRDSGMAGSAAAQHRRALAAAPLEEVAAAVGAVIDEIAPDVVVTYDTTGGYGHPDHIRVHEAVLRALWDRTDPALFAVVTPQSWAEENRTWVTEHPPAGEWVLPGPHTAYDPSVVPDAEVTHVVEDLAARDRQRAALRAHATQVHVGDEWYALSNAVVHRLDGREAFVRLRARGAGAPPPDAAGFRAVMGRFPTGVCVLTTVAGGMDHAMTADTLTSVSLDPLLVLFCVSRDTRFHDAVTASGRVGISVLAADQQELAVWFATRGRPLADQLDRAPHTRGVHTGAALLNGALAHLECTTFQVHEAGDHTIVVARVVTIGSPDGSRPALLHHRGAYGSSP